MLEDNQERVNRGTRYWFNQSLMWSILFGLIGTFIVTIIAGITPHKDQVLNTFNALCGGFLGCIIGFVLILVLLGCLGSMFT